MRSQEPNVILIGSSSCSLPAQVGKARAAVDSESGIDTDYMGDLHATYPLVSPREAESDTENKTVKMRVDIRVIKNNEEPTIVSSGLVAPPTSPSSSGSNLQLSELNEAREGSKFVSRHRSAPAAISQYRQTVLSSSSQWVRRHALESNKREKPCIVISRKKPSSAVRPFSERDNKTREEYLSPIHIRPVENRVTGPELGSFKGNSCLSPTSKMWKLKNLRKQASAGDATPVSNPVVWEGSGKNHSEVESQNRVNQYVSELKNNLKASALDARPITYSAWSKAIRDRSSLSRHKINTNLFPSQGAPKHTSRTPRISKSQPDSKLVRQEILSRIIRENPGGNFLEVLGDMPPSRLPLSDSTRSDSNTSLLQNAQKGTKRYANQFIRSTLPSRINTPACTELKSLNRKLLQDHSFYNLSTRSALLKPEHHYWHYFDNNVR